MNIIAPMHLYAARRLRGQGDIDGGLTVARKALTELYDSSNFYTCDVGTNTLVESLLARRAEGDLEEAEAAVDRLAALVPGQQWAVRDAYVLRLRALLAQARNDDETYRQLRDRYRTMAHELGYEGHMAWADAMP